MQYAKGVLRNVDILQHAPLLMAKTIFFKLNTNLLFLMIKHKIRRQDAIHPAAFIQIKTAQITSDTTWTCALPLIIPILRFPSLLAFLPVIIGQSMGGYVGQAYAELFPEKLKGFISIDSAPLQRCYVTSAELWLLKRMEPVYRHYPWKSLLKSESNGVATSEYGRGLMLDMMMVYDDDQERYAKISGHGFKILAEAMEADLPYQLKCPSQLVCGEKNHAGSCIRYNKAWHRKTGIPIQWIKGAGHNSNTDEPDCVNQIIENFIKTQI
jgi:pimeloyl-ACP methyl ester carboxylesterase